jgi:hypothetical protein
MDFRASLSRSTRGMNHLLCQHSYNDLKMILSNSYFLLTRQRNHCLRFVLIMSNSICYETIALLFHIILSPDFVVTVKTEYAYLCSHLIDLDPV